MSTRNERIEALLSAEDALGETVAHCLELETSEAQLLLEDLAKFRPEIAEAAQRRLGLLCELGWHETGESTDGEELPERLGDFRLIRRVGMGGMGVVYLAEQVSLSRRVALKLIQPGQLYFPGTRARFDRECRIVAQLDHEGIVPIYAVGEELGIPYYAMQWLEGASLGEILHSLRDRKARNLQPQDFDEALQELLGTGDEFDHGLFRRHFPGKTWVEMALSMTEQVARALEYAHRRGITHRDVKPSNLMVTKDARILLVDFGLAASRDALPGLTRTGALVGTLGYLAPEHWSESSLPPGPTSDIYSLGVTLYEFLTMQSPFEGMLLESLREAVLRRRYKPVREVLPSIGWAASVVCEKALAAKPAERYASAAAFAEDLHNARLGFPIQARRPGLIKRGVQWVRVHPRAAATILALLTIAFVSTVFAFREIRLRHSIEVLADIQSCDALLEEEASLYVLSENRVMHLEDWIARSQELSRRLPQYREALRAVTEREVHAGILPPRNAHLLDAAISTYREALGLWKYLQFSRAPDADPRELKVKIEQHLTPVETALASGRSELLDVADTQAKVLFDEILLLIPHAGEGLDGEHRETQQTEVLRSQWRTCLDQLKIQYMEPQYSKETNRGSELRSLVERLDLLQNRLVRASDWLSRFVAQDLRGDEHVRSWQHAISEIEKLEVYRGQKISPKTGLLPLQYNPSSGLWEFWLPDSGLEPTPAPSTLDPFRSGVASGEAIILVLLPGGQFTIGAPDESGTLGTVSSPNMRVVLDPFFIAKYELRADQAHNLGIPLEADLLRKGAMPVALPWNLHAYLQAWGLTLPTEAQWEYAALSGNHEPNCIDTLENFANCGNLRDRSALRVYAEGDGPGSHQSYLEFEDGYSDLGPAGAFTPNAFGIYDMVGNLQEWCQETFVFRAYKSLIPMRGDGHLKSTIQNSLRSTRGGSYILAPEYAYPWARRGEFAEASHGFRIVMKL